MSMSVRRQPAVGPTGATGSTGATGATGATGPAGTAPPGTPVLRGPYTVDYTDIPHDGDTLVLWTPQAGDVLLALWADRQTVTQWDSGWLYIGQNVNAEVSPPHNVFCHAQLGNIGLGPPASLDMVFDGYNTQQYDAAGGTFGTAAHVFHAADPVQIQLVTTIALAGGTGLDPTVGHVDLYALVARATAP